MSIQNASFRQRVMALVAQIPAGQVATYGQIAALAGSPRAARQVGGVLSALPPDTAVPWQRVINRQGSLSTWRKGCGELQQALLEAEGIVFDASGACDLSCYGWSGPLPASE